MATNQAQEGAPAVIEEAVVFDDAMTSHGFTVGELITNAKTEIQQVRDEAAGIQRQLNEANAKITQLTAALEAAQAKPKFTDEEITKAVTQMATPARGVRTLPDGSIIVPQVRVNVDSATQLMSWAKEAGENEVEYISKAIDEGLLLYTSQ